MSKPHRTTGKRTPFDTPGIQIRNPLAMGTIDVVTSKEHSVIQYVPAEEKEEERMPGFNVKKFMEKATKGPEKRPEKPKVKKKSLLYRVVQSVSKALLMLFPENKLDKSKYKKDEQT